MDQILNRLLATKTVSSYDDYTKVLRDATEIFEKNMINTIALTKIVISKSPSEIKFFQFQVSSTKPSWQEFAKNAEESACIAFPEKVFGSCIQSKVFC
ncbi:hypothetical protein ENBRE01_3344 [Enteropsectra breve]|nr:hypothetical protein ENBRE01_3344 [Enteropsectra breve]